MFSWLHIAMANRILALECIPGRRSVWILFNQQMKLNRCTWLSKPPCGVLPVLFLVPSGCVQLHLAWYLWWCCKKRNIKWRNSNFWPWLPNHRIPPWKMKKEKLNAESYAPCLVKMSITSRRVSSMIGTVKSTVWHIVTFLIE